jgi:hypothetical protein
MAFNNPQVIGLKDAREYLADKKPTTKEEFMKEGERKSQLFYQGKPVGDRYLEGWERAWVESNGPVIYPKGYGQAKYPPSLEEELDDKLRR